MVDYAHMLESQPRSSGLQGGAGTVSPNTEVPQQSLSGDLQGASSQDILTQPSTGISVPSAGSSQQASLTQESTSFAVDSFVLVGAFTFALLLIVLLAKFAKPAQGGLEKQNAPESGHSPSGNTSTELGKDFKSYPIKTKKKTRRQRRKG